jgi:hypothetical protein
MISTFEVGQKVELLPIPEEEFKSVVNPSTLPICRLTGRRYFADGYGKWEACFGLVSNVAECDWVDDPRWVVVIDDLPGGRWIAWPVQYVRKMETGN